MEAPTRLNGLDVVQARLAPRQGAKVEGYVVIVKREDEYITAFWAPHMGTCWHQGHYAMTLSQALDDMHARLARGW